MFLLVGFGCSAPARDPETGQTDPPRRDFRVSSEVPARSGVPVIVTAPTPRRAHEDDSVSAGASIAEPVREPVVSSTPMPVVGASTIAVASVQTETETKVSPAASSHANTVSDSDATSSASASSGAAPGSVPADEDKQATTADGKAAAAKDGLALHGSLSTRFRLRDSGDARDQDIYSVLALELGDASRDRFSARFLGRLSADIDGQGDAQTQQTFGSLQDTHGKLAHFDVYEASVDVRHPFEAPVNARLGRQIDYATPEFANFDGLRVESDPIGRAKIVAGAYGGVPVRLYSATSIGDQIAGAWAEGRPWTGGRVRADWMYVHQDDQPTSYDDDLVGLSLWQRVGQHLLLDGGYTRLESEDRDVRLRATWDDGKGDWMVQAGFYRLLNPLRDFASEFDPFYSTLQQYEPYTQYRVLVSKALGKRVRVDVGGDVRRLDDSGDEGRLNHDYERGYGSVVVSDVLTKGLDLSLTGDTWNSDGQDIRTWGVDLTWKAGTSWRFSAGSAYALYKYDVIQDVERDHVRTWYARARRVLSSSWTLDLGYDFENGNYDDYQVITAGATWHF